MLKSIPQRISAIRRLLDDQQIDAFIIPREDEYLGEYVPPHNERLGWATGFTGSAGVAIILKTQAVIFVDGRYTVQVTQQVDMTLFDTHHLIDTPYLTWLFDQLSPGQVIGIDPRTVTYAWLQQVKIKAQTLEITLLEMEANPIDTLWQDRPHLPSVPGNLVPLSIAGQSSFDKRQEIGQQIKKTGAQAVIITALDSIAWLLNIRGHDIPRLPVILSHAILYHDGQLDWFVDLAKVPKDFSQHVGCGIKVYSPQEFTHTLERLGSKKLCLMADSHTSNAWSQRLADNYGIRLLDHEDPCLRPKACKNPTEIEGMRQAHLRDAVAMVRFLAWFDDEVTAGRLYDEGVLAEQLKQLRLGGDGCHDLSFDTISAAGPNAAMCHYNHLNTEPSPLKMDSLYLVDSGGQYDCGTTDITRTLAVGTPSCEMVDNFTLVLKGMISLSQQAFPKGTSGSQLDSLARQYLWQHGLDYDHGTGHGVGHFLSVHEGPQRIAKKVNSVELELGMVLSNEPGYYKTNKYGIRCENLVVVKPQKHLSNERVFYGFETLTWVPFDKRLINTNRLNHTEINWLNSYHQQVFSKLQPMIIEKQYDPSVLSWLEQACAKIPASDNV